MGRIQLKIGHLVEVKWMLYDGVFFLVERLFPKIKFKLMIDYNDDSIISIDNSIMPSLIILIII